MQQLHEIQRAILRKLIFNPTLKYSQLKPSAELGNNQFDFHLDRLIEAGLVAKVGNQYQLTNAGKTFTIQFDTDQVKIVQQAKLSAWLGVMRKVKGKYQFLIYTRLKHPFYGCQGFPGGKIQFGENIVDAAKRELLEETGLVGEPEIIRLIHYRVLDDHQVLQEDKMMFLCRFVNPIGDLIKANEEGKYEWIDEAKLLEYVTNPFEDVTAFKQQIEYVKAHRGRPVIEEIDHPSHKF